MDMISHERVDLFLGRAAARVVQRFYDTLEPVVISSLEILNRFSK